MRAPPPDPSIRNQRSGKTVFVPPARTTSKVLVFPSAGIVRGSREKAHTRGSRLPPRLRNKCLRERLTAMERFPTLLWHARRKAPAHRPQERSHLPPHRCGKAFRSERKSHGIRGALPSRAESSRLSVR